MLSLTEDGEQSVQALAFLSTDLQQVYSSQSVQLMRILIGCKADLSAKSSLLLGDKVQFDFLNKTQKNMRNLANTSTTNSNSLTTSYSLTKGSLSIKVKVNTKKAAQYSGNSFIIATAVSVSVLIVLLIIVIFCARRRRLLQKKKRDAQMQRDRTELQRNNPQSNINQQLLQNLLSQNPMAMIAHSVLLNMPQAVEKEDKQYFQDIDKCFPLQTLQQIHEYFKDEVPNMKKEDVSKECAICYCDFEEEEELVESASQIKNNSTASNIKNKTNNTQNTTIKTTNNNYLKRNKPTIRLFTFCNHFFHNSCITDWLKKDKSCPHCRQKVTQFELNQIKNHIEDKVIARTKRVIEKMRNSKKSVDLADKQNSSSNQKDNSQEICQQSNANQQQIQQNSIEEQNKQNQQEEESQQNTSSIKINLNSSNQANKSESQIATSPTKLNQGFVNTSLSKLTQENDSNLSNESITKKNQIIDSFQKKKSLTISQFRPKSPTKNKGDDPGYNIQEDAIRIKKNTSFTIRQSIGSKSALNSSQNNLNSSIVSERLQDSVMEQSVVIEEDISKLNIQTQEDDDEVLNRDALKNIQILELIKEEEEEDKIQAELKESQEFSFSQQNKFNAFNTLSSNQFKKERNFTFQKGNTNESQQIGQVNESIQSQRSENKEEKPMKKIIKNQSDQNHFQNNPKSNVQILVELNDLSSNSNVMN